MSRISFRDFYLDNILTFLWRQWSALGVAGGARAEEKWVIDPEALLIFSLRITRYEPRLFDEILDWLVLNGKRIDIQRLRGILRRKDAITKCLISTVAFYVSKESKTNGRKWRTLSSLNRKKSGAQDEMLFITKKGEPYPQVRHKSAVFKEYGFIREDFPLRAMTKPVSVNTQSNIRFLLRSLFGIGSRAECILYLLTHEAGHPNEIAAAIGVSTRAAQDTLIELAESGLVLTRIKGKRKIEYWLSQERWWEFLAGMNFEDIKKPVWLDWISLCSALTNVWNILNEIEKSKSDYMRSSKLREAMEEISLEFEKSRLDLPPVPGREVKPSEYEEEFQNFIIKVLGARNGTGR